MAGSVGAAASCEATACSAGAAGVGRSGGGVRLGRGLVLRPVRLIRLPERVGVLLVTRALGHRGGGEGEQGHGEKQCN